MKKFLLSTFVLFTFAALNAQISITPTSGFCESFTQNSNGTGWDNNSGNFAKYSNPDIGCQDDNGYLTPGVSGTNPSALMTPTINSSVAGGKILVNFDIWQFTNTSKCDQRLPIFECPVLVDIYAVKGNATLSNTGVPAAADILEPHTGFILTAGGSYALIISLPAGVSSCRILYNFRIAQNCSLHGKFVLDNFCFNLSACQLSSNCPPVANDDAFVLPSNDKNQLFKGDLTGGSLQFLPSISGYPYSLQSGPGNQSVLDGLDFDPDGGNRTAYTWSIVNQGTAATYGTVTVNANGTFEFQRNGVPASGQQVVKFTYQLSDGTNTDNADVYITIPSNASLPVLFKSFNAVQSNGKVALTWETAQEINNKEFQVQRRNATGGFETIATIPSKALNGNSAQVLAYSYDDLDNLTGKGQMYYRIKQVDINTHADYSETRSIRNNAKNVNITVYPNPGRDLVKVTIPDGVGLVDVSVSDMSGKEVKRWNSTGAKNIELTNLRPGLYTIRVNIKESGDMLVNKLIIQ